MRTRGLPFAIRIAIIAFLGFMLAGVSSAQNSVGTIRGQVTDPSAAAVVGASVIVTTPDGKSLAATTNRDGVFELKGLTPGKYTVEVISKGFALYRRSRTSRGRPSPATQHLVDHRRRTTTGDGDRTSGRRGRQSDEQRGCDCAQRRGARRVAR